MKIVVPAEVRRRLNLRISARMRRAKSVKYFKSDAATTGVEIDDPSGQAVIDDPSGQQVQSAG